MGIPVQFSGANMFSGRTQPPVYVGDEESCRSIVVDFGGVWRRA